ncbi:MAG: hypothetical protein AAGF96_06125 [Bacteroidota bacterium]
MNEFKGTKEELLELFNEALALLQAFYFYNTDEDWRNEIEQKRKDAGSEGTALEYTTQRAGTFIKKIQDGEL